MSEIKYTEGYVAFIDILGFSNLVLDKNNANKVKNVTEYIGKLQYLFNTSPSINARVAFFSDSIVITTDKKYGINMLFMAILLAEINLYFETGLFFRGGITKGLFYHEGSVAFGPAIVEAYHLENQAIYSRVIIQDDIIAEFVKKPIVIFRDTDGKLCFNPYALGIFGDVNVCSVTDAEPILSRFEEERKKLFQVIKDNLHTPVADKYVWRIRPFNLTCKIMLLTIKDLGIEISNNVIEELKAIKISMDDFFDVNIY